jgi:hypothetical protein
VLVIGGVPAWNKARVFVIGIVQLDSRSYPNSSPTWDAAELMGKSAAARARRQPPERSLMLPLASRGAGSATGSYGASGGMGVPGGG